MNATDVVKLLKVTVVFINMTKITLERNDMNVINVTKPFYVSLIIKYLINSCLRENL